MSEVNAVVRSNVLNESDDKNKAERLKKAVVDFEALFINHMLKTMRSTITKNGLLGDGMRGDVYTSLFDWEISKKMASGRGLGLGEMLMKGLNGNKGSVEQRPVSVGKASLK